MSQDLTREFSRQFGKEHVNPLADLLEQLEKLSQFGLLHELDPSLVVRMRKILDAHPTPASEPSEQPVADAEAHFMKYLRGLIIAAWKNGHELWNSSEDFAYTHYDYDVLPTLNKLVSQYARHASAKAVEAERQRLARLRTILFAILGDNYGTHDDKQYEIRPKHRDALEAWLAGEGENA